MPSGTQSNLAALMSHCGRGDEYLVGQEAHTYRFEAGGGATIGGPLTQTTFTFDPLLPAYNLLNLRYVAGMTVENSPTKPDDTEPNATTSPVSLIMGVVGNVVTRPPQVE